MEEVRNIFEKEKYPKEFSYLCSLLFYLIFELIMKTGTVKFFNESRGFGFIKEDDTQQEIFVHVSGIKQPLREGDKVTFEVSQGKKGLNAINVRKI